MEDPLSILENMDTALIYGVLGARLTKNIRGEFFKEYIGKILNHPSQEEDPQELGTDFSHGAIVDTLHQQCLMVHSDLLFRHALRFDSHLKCLHVEDFCLTAADAHTITSAVLHMRCCYHGQIITEASPAEFSSDLSYCKEKYAAMPPRAGMNTLFGKESFPLHTLPLLRKTQHRGAADIYHRSIDGTDHNLPSVLVADFLRPDSTVLDVGCSGGDNGVFFKQTRNASLWGLEFDPESITLARATGAYEAVYPVDLEHFYASDHNEFYGFFDHIFFGDVLEHLRNPLETLKQCKPLLSPSGSILASLPNVAHGYVITNLLAHSFHYADCGVLDATHLRFFTKNSMAAFFAAAGLEIQNATATFLIPDEHPLWPTPQTTPPELYALLNENKHFFVCQYITELTPSQSPEAALTKHNREKLDAAPNRNTLGFAEKSEDLHHYSLLQELYTGTGYPEEFQKEVTQLWSSGQHKEAIDHSRLFDEDWYRDHCPETLETGADLLHHYLTEGWIKGSDPSPLFQTQWYLDTYPDVAKARMCPIVHYIAHGMNEGRSRKAPK